ncbi:MAG: hypothetical protein AAF713_09730 [Pseudomonadota bacterium]
MTEDRSIAASEADPLTFEQLRSIDMGPYLYFVPSSLGILSVFDDLKYDRADADMLSPAMRQHAIKTLGRLGFRQKSGTVLEHRGSATRCLIPKFHALGASPFDITRYTARGERDFYLLTPTQTACAFVDTSPLDEAVAQIGALVARQPINLYRLMDYLERKPAHKDFMKAIGHLKYLQRMAVESEPLRRRRALG